MTHRSRGRLGPSGLAACAMLMLAGAAYGQTTQPKAQDEKKPAAAQPPHRQPEKVPENRNIVKRQVEAGHAGHDHAAHAAQDVPAPTVVLKPGEAPAIQFDMMEYDFGRIRAGGDVIHDFWFTNTGTGPLELLRVKPG